MSDFIKYCKQNKKRLLNIIILSIVPIYIIFSILFPNISIKFSKFSIVQIFMVLVILYFAINIRKVKLKRLKEIIKKYKEFMNKNILVKSVTILGVIFLLTNILNAILKI